MTGVAKPYSAVLPPNSFQIPYLDGGETAQQDLGELSPEVLAALAEALMLKEGKSLVFPGQVARGPIVPSEAAQKEMRLDSHLMLSRATETANRGDTWKAHQMALGAAWLFRLAYFPYYAEIAEGAALRFGNESWRALPGNRMLDNPFATDVLAYAELMARPPVAWTMARGLGIEGNGRTPYLVFDIDGTIIDEGARNVVIDRNILPNPIWPIMALASAARARGFKIIVASSRGLEDDGYKDGSSRTQQMLRNIGFWKDGDALILKEGGGIRVSPEFAASNERQNPQKAGRVMRFVTNNGISPQDVIAVFENDPEQLRGFADIFGNGMATVLVLGEAPPGGRPPHAGAIPLSPRPHLPAPGLLPSLSGVYSLQSSLQDPFGREDVPDDILIEQEDIRKAFDLKSLQVMVPLSWGDLTGFLLGKGQNNIDIKYAVVRRGGTFRIYLGRSADPYSFYHRYLVKYFEGADNFVSVGNIAQSMDGSITIFEKFNLDGLVRALMALQGGPDRRVEVTSFDFLTHPFAHLRRELELSDAVIKEYIIHYTDNTR